MKKGELLRHTAVKQGDGYRHRMEWVEPGEAVTGIGEDYSDVRGWKVRTWGDNLAIMGGCAVGILTIVGVCWLLGWTG